jgi:hypothetical protein
VKTAADHRLVDLSLYFRTLVMSSIAARRLGKELKEIHEEGCPVGELLI